MIQDDMDKRITQLAKRMGSENATRLLSVLGKDRSFLDAIDTTVGQELVRDLISSIERIIGVILNEKDDDNDRAELRAYMSILKRWQGRIKAYNKNHNTFMEKSK